LLIDGDDQASAATFAEIRAEAQNVAPQSGSRCASCPASTMRS
jgi:hypothetical protein